MGLTSAREQGHGYRLRESSRDSFSVAWQMFGLYIHRTVLEIGLNSSQILTATTHTDINDLRFTVVEIQPTYFSWEERYRMKLQDGRNIC